MGKFTISGTADGSGHLKFDKAYTGGSTSAVQYEGGIFKDAATGNFYMGGKWLLGSMSGVCLSVCDSVSGLCVCERARARGGSSLT